MKYSLLKDISIDDQLAIRLVSGYKRLTYMIVRMLFIEISINIPLEHNGGHIISIHNHNMTCKPTHKKLLC